MHRDVKPLLARANEIADEASETATMATAQAQKVDKMVTDLTRRVDETSDVVQHAIITPAREGIAIVAALKAGFSALARVRQLPRPSRPAQRGRRRALYRLGPGQAASGQTPD